MDILGIDRADGPTQPPSLVLQKQSGEVVSMKFGHAGLSEEPYPLRKRFGAAKRGEPDPCPGFEPIVSDGQTSIEDNAASWYVSHASALSGPDLDMGTAKDLASVLTLETQPAGASLFNAVLQPEAIATSATEMRAPAAPQVRAEGLRIQRDRYRAAQAGADTTFGYEQLGVPEVDRVLARGRNLLEGMLANDRSEP